MLVKLCRYRAMHVVHAWYCCRKSSVRLSVCSSVCPSVTLRYRGRIGWTCFSKLITPLISLESWLHGATTLAIYSKGNTPKFGLNRGGVQSPLGIFDYPHTPIVGLDGELLYSPPCNASGVSISRRRRRL